MSDSVNVKVLNDFDRELVKVVAAVLVDPTTGQPYKVTGGGGGSTIDFELLLVQDSTGAQGIRRELNNSGVITVTYEKLDGSAWVPTAPLTLVSAVLPPNASTSPKQDLLQASVGDVADAPATDNTGSWSLLALIKKLLGIQTTSNTSLAALSASVTPPSIVTGALTALNATIPISTDGFTNGILQCSTVGVGTFVMEGSLDGVTWATLAMTSSSNVGGSSDAASNTIVGVFYFVAACPFVRVRMSAYTSGTFTFALALLNGSSPIRSVFINNGSTSVTSAGTINGATLGIAASNSSNTVGNVVRLAASAATTNATLVKAGASKLVSVVGYNTSTAVKYLRIYNKATAPTVGTDTPLLVFAMPPSASFQFDLGNIGFYCPTGLGFAITNASALLDATVIAANDVVALNIIYV